MVTKSAGPQTTLSYVAPSRLDDAGLGLSTSGGRADHPYFFRGFVDNAEQAARALLAVAEVSQSRYFDLSARADMKDPVVTSNVSALRFESFSACNGVYARFDIDAEGFDAEWVDWGTTNVDLNAPVRLALAAITPGEALRLTVGADAVEFETLGDAVVESKVPLPERWLRGFAETQIAASAMRPIVRLSGAQARIALREFARLKLSERTPWVSFAGPRPLATSTPTDQTPCLVGGQRVGALARLSGYATGLTVYAPERRRRLGMGGSAGHEWVRQPSAWVVDMEGARFTLVVSPELYRGFSGEGAVLGSLAKTPEEQVRRVEQELRGQAILNVADLAAATGLASEHVEAALAVLGASGRTGFDLHAGAFFHRDLPYDRTVLSELQPRLKDAWQLVSLDAVTAAEGGGAFDVLSRDSTYRVVLGEVDRCTCPWFAKHRGERGPCKHVLAAGLVGADALSR
ncbi:SWIM zinc finger family protein [Demequina aurantiaca]|uniref:SWIM zinc finger family protein n=1 Tax=Demequina aurantiaca TaxID=676200 RepID=UPI003D35235C